MPAGRRPRPRIRSILPETMWRGATGRLSDRAFRLFVGLTTLSDDEGRLMVDLEELRVVIWGHHAKVAVKDVATALDELCVSELAQVYPFGSNQVCQLLTWEHDQRVDHPTLSILPAYNNGSDSSRDLAIPQENSRDLAKGVEGHSFPFPSLPKGGAGGNRAEPVDLEPFRSMWKLHPYGSKKDAEAKYRMHKPPAEALAALQAQLEYRKRKDWSGAFVPALPHLSRWISGHRWEDVIPAEPAQQPLLRTEAAARLALPTHQEALEQVRKHLHGEAPAPGPGPVADALLSAGTPPKEEAERSDWEGRFLKAYVALRRRAVDAAVKGGTP